MFKKMSLKTKAQHLKKKKNPKSFISSIMKLEDWNSLYHGCRQMTIPTSLNLFYGFWLSQHAW